MKRADLLDTFGGYISLDWYGRRS